MKTFTIFLIGIFSFTAIATSIGVQAQPGFSASASFDNFYRELSPYGQWRDVPRYGRVWSYNEPGFRPYATNGQWEYRDDDWYWASGYEWGAIPFHYGRWELDPYYGWIWIPGYDYAPAWVAWSQADDCYGWAPLGFGLDINVSFGRIPSDRWMYASAGNIGRPRIDRYCVPYERSRFYYGRQQPIINIHTNRNVRYMAGPERYDRNQGNRYRDQRPDVNNNRYDNRRGDDYNARRPGNNENNNGRYGNNGDRRSDNVENGRSRSDNNIHFDPATQYDRNRAIAESRPQRPVSPDTRGREQNERPQVRQQAPRQLPQAQVNSQHQMRVTPQPQRSSGGGSPRPSGNRERRIF